MSAMLHESLCQRLRAWTCQCRKMQRTVSLLVQGIWIGADEQECLDELWKWKLANWISTYKSRFTVTR